MQDLQGGGPLRPIVNDVDAEFRPFVRGDKLYLWTNWNAPNWRILSVDLQDPERSKWKEIVPESSGRLTAATGAVRGSS